MLVLVMILVAAVLLGHGVLTESTGEVAAAGIVAVIGALVSFAPRVLDRFRQSTSGEDDATQQETSGPVVTSKPPEVAAVTPHPAPAEAPPQVVFVAGRTTFHSRDCQSVAGKVTSSALRAELEVGGMTPCRRCLPASTAT